MAERRWSNRSCMTLSVYDSSFLAREQQFAVEKRRIGLAAAELVQANETIGLSAGTTTTRISAVRFAIETRSRSSPML